VPIKKSVFLFIILVSALFAQQTSPLPNDEKAKKIRTLVNKLSSTSSQTEMAGAINQIQSMGHDALPYLGYYLLNDKRTYVKVQITGIMGKLKDTSSVPLLEQTAQKTVYPALKKSSIFALGEIGGAPSVEALKRIRRATQDTALLQILNVSLQKNHSR
jgi:hypothetical protein